MHPHHGQKNDERHEPSVEALLVLLLGAHEFACHLGRRPSDCGLKASWLRQLGASDDAVESLARDGLVVCPPERRAGRRGGNARQTGQCIVLTKAGMSRAWRLLLAQCGEGTRRRLGSRATKEGKPHWDRKTGQLYFDRTMILQVQRRSSFQWLVLQAFEESRWKERVENPLRATKGYRDDRLLQTVKDLNRRQEPRRLRFRVEADGQSVRWDEET